MQKILHDLIEKSHLGFILCHRFEETVQKRCKKEIDLFNNNYAFIRRILKAIALKSGVLVINLASELYLFSLHKFLSANTEHLKSKYIKKLNNKCSKKAHAVIQNPAHVPLLNPEECKKEDNKSNSNSTSPSKFSEELPKSEFSKEDLEKELDLSKIIVVDNEEAIEKAFEVMSKSENIGVDLEGDLNKGGKIELI